jgi:hypothetical protein
LPMGLVIANSHTLRNTAESTSCRTKAASASAETTRAGQHYALYSHHKATDSSRH